MPRSNQPFAYIHDQKARKAAYEMRIQQLMRKAYELTILCNVSICMIIFSGEENKLVVWPYHNLAKSLMNRFFALPYLERNTKADDQESFIKANIKRVEKKLAQCRKQIVEIEMDHLMYHLHTGLLLVDLSWEQVKKLKSYTKKKIVRLEKELCYRKHPYACLNERSSSDDNERSSSDDEDVESQWEGSVMIPMGINGSNYYMDQWFSLDKPKVEKNSDATHLPSNGDDEDMESETGESSKSSVVDDSPLKEENIDA